MNARAAHLVAEHLSAKGEVQRPGSNGPADPEGAVRAFDELPEFVRNAKFRQITQRVLDDKLFEKIVSQKPMQTEDTGWPDRLKRRSDALEPLIGKTLACVYVRLPGVHYTIEVDSESGEVVYWEWQAH